MCKQNTPLNCAFDKMITKIIIYYINSELCTEVPVGCKICIYSIHVQCYTDSDSQQHTAQRWTGVYAITCIFLMTVQLLLCYHCKKTLTTHTERLG